MPETYTVKLSDGREFDVTTEGGPPSEAAILASLAQSDAPKAGSAPVAENSRPGSNTALGMAAAARTVPAAANAAMEIATNPAVPKATAAIGRVVGAVAPVVGGAGAGGPVGALAGVGAAAKGAWAGGKAGWFTGKMAQSAARPVAAVADAVAPYAQTLGTLSGAQGALDLAQMAEPDRRDIGVLGVGPSVRSGAIPDTPKLVSMPIEDAVKSLTDVGWPESRAKSYVAQMRKLMNR